MTSLTLPSGAASFGSLGGAVADNAALVAALALKLDKAGGTMTGALINSTNGAASAPAVQVTGTPFSGGSATTTKPLFLVETAGATSNTWGTSGTMFGTNAPSGFAGNDFDFQRNGVSKLRYNGSSMYFGGDIDLNTLGSGGRLFLAGNVLQAIFGGSARWQCNNSGDMSLSGNVALTSAASIDFSSTTAFSGSKDVGIARTSAGVARVSNGSSGRGTLDAAGYQVGGVAGANFGPGLPTSITVVNGIITAAS